MLREKRRQVRLLAMCGGWNEVHKFGSCQEARGVGGRGVERKKKKEGNAFEKVGRRREEGMFFFEGTDGKIHKRIRIMGTGKVDN